MLANAEDVKFDRDTIAQCCEVATFTTLEDSMKLNTLNKQQKARVMLVLEHDEWVEKHVNVPWPSFSVTVHPHTTHGAEFPLVPRIWDSTTDCRLFWF
jgi:hypothetical protein